MREAQKIESRITSSHLQKLSRKDMLEYGIVMAIFLGVYKHGRIYPQMVADLPERSRTSF